MMPIIDTAPIKHVNLVEPILPDNWPILQSGVLRVVPWIAAAYDAHDAETAALNARTLRTAINRGDTQWRDWTICWTKEQRESVRSKLPIDVSEDFG